jgi:hypothetical protein
MKIELDNLLEIIDVLKQNVAELFPDGIDIELEDFYWEIPEKLLFDPINGPGELTLGQLNEDWLELLRLLTEENIPISYDLKRLSIILQIIRIKSIGIW